VSDARVAKSFRLPADLIARYEARAKMLGCNNTEFLCRALEAALGGGPRPRARPVPPVPGPRPSDAETTSPPPASPRAPVDPGVARAAAFRARTQRGSGG